MGLPRAPFVLERADLSDEALSRLPVRKDVQWRDKNGARLDPIFSISRGDEATAFLPAGSGAGVLWAEVIADPAAAPQPELSVVPHAPGGFLDRLPGRFRDSFERLPEIVPPTPHLADGPRASGMQVEAFMRSAAGGEVSVGVRKAPPFAFAAPGLTRLVVRGAGSVVGVRLIEADKTPQLAWQVIDVLNLPHAGGRRYPALSGWERLCAERVRAQAPRRRPMHDLSAATPRFSAPPHDPGAERDRVATLFEAVEEPLDALIDGPTPQHLLVLRQTLTNADGSGGVAGGAAEASVFALGLALQAQVDPGLASWMGMKTLDAVETDLQPRLSLYRLTGFFADPPADALARAGAAAALLIAAARRAPGLSAHDDLMGAFSALAEPWLAARGVALGAAPEAFRGFALGALAAADRAAPPAPLAPPRLAPPRHVAWRADSPEDPRRVIEMGVSGAPPAGALAAMLRQPPGSGGWAPLNPAQDVGAGAWRSLIVPAPPGEDPSFPAPEGATGQALISCASAGPERFAFHAAAMDRFGRWSDFAAVVGEAGPRPLPPRPVLMGAYAPPDVATGARAGRVSATVPLPDAAALAPGAFPLSHLRLTAEVDGAPFGPVRTAPVSDAVETHPNAAIAGLSVPPGQEQPGLRFAFDGPVIPAGRARSLTLTAVWVDAAGRVSAPSEPVRLRMADPYPPPQIAIADVLDYAARPDATGAAWVERDIAGDPAHRYVVLYADENRLRDHLRRSSAPEDAALLASLEAEPDPAARATLLRAAQARFPGHLFERLKAVVETEPRLRFRHALPGSLRVLSAYRIAAESALNAAGPDPSALDTVFYAVPNAEPPARPSVRVRMVPPAPGEPDLVVEATVTLRAAVTPGARARIRRTRSGVVDPLRNPIVGTAEMGPVDPVTGLQTATFRDVGAALAAPAARLAAFVEYAWIAEVQGAPEPGSAMSASGPVPGLWSEPSAPAVLTTIPDAPPPAPALVAASGAPAAGGVRDLRLDFVSAQDLTPGAPSPWRIRIERALPDQGLTLLSEAPAVGGREFSVVAAPGEVTPGGARYRVRLIDPVGRESPAVEHIV
ncbi:hypothetical protein SAMN05216200_10995 [Oceanicella actignis]|uniref:Uncharacterized protein n=1 Tax=Oceanicella actignis TaxID=1189325 RepID=A0A1M7TSP8_9RHOB|nr:hypothetical protein SAMN04488119_10927 [Oceanicella actignis]SHN73751.1 hypothetical protein SAMN05216200_10995 [Oceanicella actignis]